MQSSVTLSGQVTIIVNNVTSISDGSLSKCLLVGQVITLRICLKDDKSQLSLLHLCKLVRLHYAADLRRRKRGGMFALSQMSTFLAVEQKNFYGDMVKPSEVTCENVRVVVIIRDAKTAPPINARLQKGHCNFPNFFYFFEFFRFF